MGGDNLGHKLKAWIRVKQAQAPGNLFVLDVQMGTALGWLSSAHALWLCLATHLRAMCSFLSPP